MIENCTHCGICTEHCRFLKKYELNIGDTRELQELAYHCFLCGRCTEVCPQGIDGREEMLRLRQEQVKQNGNVLAEKGYDMLLKEKENYIFRNYKNVTGESILFPGCNFPSFYPKTTKYLAQLLKDRAGISVAYDCCGKPISELGMEQSEKRIVTEMEERLLKYGVKEVIMVCPNCYYYLKPRLQIPVVSIYEVLQRYGIGESIADREVNLFLPCPDKGSRYWYQELRAYLLGEHRVIEDIPCCGLGGCARGKEPEIAKDYTGQLTERGCTSVYTYCGSCAGKFARDGFGEVHHVLSDILGVCEQPDTAKSMVNRTMSRFWKTK